MRLRAGRSSAAVPTSVCDVGDAVEATNPAGQEVRGASRWVSVGDDDVRPRHAARATTSAPLDMPPTGATAEYLDAVGVCAAAGRVR